MMHPIVDCREFLPGAPDELYEILAWEYSRCGVASKTSFFPEPAELEARQGVDNSSVIARLRARGLVNSPENRAYLEMVEPHAGTAVDRQLYLMTPSQYERMGEQPGTIFPWAGRSFAKTLSWIQRLPFVSIGRIVVWESYRGSVIPRHSDLPKEVNPLLTGQHHFIFFDLSLNRGLQVHTEQGVQKVASPAVMFNTSLPHEAPPSPGTVLTIRVDGKLSPEAVHSFAHGDGIRS
jgi:hypothetical protein